MMFVIMDCAWIVVLFYTSPLTADTMDYYSSSVICKSANSVNLIILFSFNILLSHKQYFFYRHQFVKYIYKKKQYKNLYPFYVDISAKNVYIKLQYAKKNR